MTRAPLRKFAILAGFAIDLAGTMISIWAVLVSAVMIATIPSNGPLTADVVAQWAGDRVYILTILVIGTAWAIAGGFAAAKIAGREPVRHAIWTGVASTVVAMLFAELRDGGAGITWFTVASFLTTIPSAAVGGYLARPR